jgi:hypothetical protein
MKHDWGNIDWSALAASKVLIGNIVAFISVAAAFSGHALPNSMQSQLTDLITQGFALIAGAGLLYSSYHRMTTQAVNATTIVPLKTPPQT